MPAKKKAAPKKPKFRVGYVALIGRPNVGKSTLLNRILGQKISIVSDKPQTTRLSILGIHTTEKGQIIFIDNPGIHKPLHGLNRRMMNFVYASLETADIIALMIDATQKYGHGDEYVLETMKKVNKPFFLLINKVDAVQKGNVLLIIDKYKDILPFKEIIPISSLKGTNVDVLERLLFENLPPAEKLYGDEDVTDQSQKFLLAEIIREKVLAHVEKELPWVTAVYIDLFERREPGAPVHPKADQVEEGEEEAFRSEEIEELSDADFARLTGEEVEEGEEGKPERTKADQEPAGAESDKKAEAAEEQKAASKTTELKAAAPLENTTKAPEKDAAGSSKSPIQKEDAQPPQEEESLSKSDKRKLRQRGPLTFIKATIFCERDNHRKIILGRHGQTIKIIGIEARREIQEILESRVYLELHVKVKPRWRDSAAVLDLIEGQKETG